MRPYPLNTPQPFIPEVQPELPFQDLVERQETTLFSSETSEDVKDASERKCDAVVKPSHYTQWKIEPINFIMRNAMPFWMGNVVKYCMRADAKNGVEDLRKAIRYIEFRIRQLEGEVDITG